MILAQPQTSALNAYCNLDPRHIYLVGYGLWSVRQPAFRAGGLTPPVRFIWLGSGWGPTGASQSLQPHSNFTHQAGLGKITHSIPSSCAVCQSTVGPSIKRPSVFRPATPITFEAHMLHGAITVLYSEKYSVTAIVSSTVVVQYSRDSTTADAKEDSGGALTARCLIYFILYLSWFVRSVRST